MANSKIDAYLKKNVDDVPIKHNIYNMLNRLYVEPRGIYKNVDVDVLLTHKSLNLLYAENKNAFVEAAKSPPRERKPWPASKPAQHGGAPYDDAPENFVFLF
jgi:hypothetical protein